MRSRQEAWSSGCAAAADALVDWTHRRPAGWAGAVGCVAVVVAVSWIGLLQADFPVLPPPLDTRYSPLDLQLAFTASEWEWILLHWSAEARALQVQMLQIDFLLILGYLASGLLGLGALARRLPAVERPRRKRLAGLAMLALLIAGCADVVENVAMLTGLEFVGWRAWLAPLASLCAVLKWAGLGAVLTFVLAWCTWRWQVPRWEAVSRRARYAVAVGLGVLLGSGLVACTARSKGGGWFGTTMAVVVGVFGSMGFASRPRRDWVLEDDEEEANADTLPIDPLAWQSSLLDMVWMEGGELNGQTVEGFWISRYPTRRRDWRALGLEVPEPQFWSERNDDDLPADNLNWFDAVQFCNALSERDRLVPCYYEDAGYERPWTRRIDSEERPGSTEIFEHSDADGYRLPTERTWEFAVRAGTTSKFHWGDDEESAEDFAWFDANSNGSPQPVDEKQPNPAGLHDMTGNVWEWSSDWYDRDRDGRALRGGSFGLPAWLLASSGRVSNWPSLRRLDFGFRVVRSPLPQHSAAARTVPH